MTMRTWLVALAAMALQLHALGLPQTPPMPTPPPRPPLFQAAQQRHDKHADDKDAFCFNPETSGSQRRDRERNPHAHACQCHLTCQVGPSGEIVGDTESNNCELYCTRERCACHVESPCEMPHA
jgi:hypothetical protein